MEEEYTGKSIQVLEGLEAVRTRPGMFLGDPHDGSALHHCVFEVFDNAVDEHLAGHTPSIEIILHADSRVVVRCDDPRALLGCGLGEFGSLFLIDGQFEIYPTDTARNRRAEHAEAFFLGSGEVTPLILAATGEDDRQLNRNLELLDRRPYIDLADLDGQILGFCWWRGFLSLGDLDGFGVDALQIEAVESYFEDVRTGQSRHSGLLENLFEGIALYRDAYLYSGHVPATKVVILTMSNPLDGHFFMDCVAVQTISLQTPSVNLNVFCKSGRVPIPCPTAGFCMSN